jgi:hypothetical protein
MHNSSNHFREFTRSLKPINKTGTPEFSTEEKTLIKITLQNKGPAGLQWLTPMILPIRKAEIRRIVVQKPAQVTRSRDPISKIPNTKKCW